MSIFSDIESLEQRIQSILAESGSYSSVDDFVRAFTDSILDALGSFSEAELGSINLDEVIDKAIKASSDFINVGMADEIKGSIDDVLTRTTAFYQSVGVELPGLKDAINRSEDIAEISKLFTSNLASMREELRDGTLEVMQSELAQGFFNREDLEELIFQYADGKAHYARTNARLVVSSYNRIGREQVRESANLQHGFYYGDARVNTRPFCLRCIGKVFTLQDIEQMDNGQLSPVKIYAGGWNCIHSWLWVDPEWDEELKNKINTDPVVPLDDNNLQLKVPGE
jgi:hypothetical protein